MGGIFLGTPAAAVPSLAAFCDVEDVDLVITQPDRRSGRGQGKLSPPVKVAAEQFGLRVAQPESASELLGLLADIRPAIGLAVAYGRIFSPEVLAAVPLGFLNVHFSLLPRWRGPAPVERAIAAGDERSGVTLMKLDEGLDTGPILGELATPIGPNETGGTLTARLAFLGASLVDSTVPDYLSGRRLPVPQLTTGATHAAKLSRSEALLSPNWTTVTAERAIRAFSPRPGSWLRTDAGNLKVHRAKMSDVSVDLGRIELVNGVVLAGFTDGALKLDTVQSQGKNQQKATDWMNGRRGVPAVFVADGP